MVDLDGVYDGETEDDIDEESVRKSHARQSLYSVIQETEYDNDHPHYRRSPQVG